MDAAHAAVALVECDTIRELANVQRDVGQRDRGHASQPIRARRRRSAADGFELSYLRALLARSSGNVTRAAAIAEVSRQRIQKLMRKHALGEAGG